MKVTTTAGALRETITTAAMITPSRPQLAAYAGVQLSATRGRLAARGTNGETTVTSVCRVSDVTDGQVLLPPGPLSKYLAALDADTTLTLEAPSATQVTVTADGARAYKFTAMSDPFPAASLPRRDKVEADLSGLKDAVNAVAACADALSSGSSEKVVQLVSNDSGLRLHATDRFRVARAALPASSGFGEFDGLLPVRVLSLISSIKPTHVQLDPRGRTMVFHAETTVVSTRLSQDPFPVVDSVLSATLPHSVRIHRGQTLDALKRLAAVVAPQGAVSLEISGDLLTLSIANGPNGSGEEQVHLPEAANGELVTAVNFEFLRSALDTHAVEDVTVGWAGPDRPLFISSQNPVPVTHAIMPVRV